MESLLQLRFMEKEAIALAHETVTRASRLSAQTAAANIHIRMLEEELGIRH